MKKIFQLNSLRKKFILVVTGLLLSVFLIDGVIAISNNIKATRDNLTQQAVAFAQLSTKPLGDAYTLYFDSGYYKFRELFENNRSLDKSISKIQFIDVNGKIILDSSMVGEAQYNGQGNQTVSQEELAKIVSDTPVYSYNSSSKNELSAIYYPYITDWQSHPFTIKYFISYDQIRQNTITIITQTSIILFLFFLFSVALITAFINRLILNPIMVVSQVSQSISLGKYGERIKINTHDEITNLAESTNKMASALEQNIIDLQELDRLKDEFIDIAAHNLKIPLHHLKFNIAYLLKKTGFDSKSKAIIEDINRHNNKLELLSDDLINITAIREGTLQSSVFLPDDLVKLLTKAINEMQGAAKSKNIAINFSSPSAAPILTDYLKLRQVFLNIIDNAIKYNKKDGQINITLTEKPEYFEVQIADTGVGVAPEELPKLFQKFYRAPSSAIYDAEGTGLGLYLAKLIIDVHHGNIAVKSDLGKGTTFIINLPKVEKFKKSH